MWLRCGASKGLCVLVLSGMVGNDRLEPLMTTALASPVAFREKAPEPLFGEGLPPASALLLQAKIKDLKLHLAGTRLEKFIHQLHE